MRTPAPFSALTTVVTYVVTCGGHALTWARKRRASAERAAQRVVPRRDLPLARRRHDRRLLLRREVVPVGRAHDQCKPVCEGGVERLGAGVVFGAALVRRARVIAASDSATA